MGLLGMSMASLASVLGGSGIDFALTRNESALARPRIRRVECAAAGRAIRADGAHLASAAIAKHLPPGVDHRYVVFPDQPLVRASDDVPDPRAGASGVCGARRPGVARGRRPACRSSCSSFAVLLSADLAEYVIHRAFHVVPVLWRFHAIHHSTQATWTGSPAGGCTCWRSSSCTALREWDSRYVLGFPHRAEALYWSSFRFSLSSFTRMCVSICPALSRGL